MTTINVPALARQLKPQPPDWWGRVRLAVHDFRATKIKESNWRVKIVPELERVETGSAVESARHKVVALWRIKGCAPSCSPTLELLSCRDRVSSLARVLDAFLVEHRKATSTSPVYSVKTSSIPCPLVSSDGRTRPHRLQWVRFADNCDVAGILFEDGISKTSWILAATGHREHPCYAQIFEALTLAGRTLSLRGANGMRVLTPAVGPSDGASAG